MKFLFDFFPLAVFLIAYKFSDIYTATATIIGASALQVSLHWLLYRRFEKMHLVSLVLIIVLGGLTLYLRDKRFIMWKPTIVNWLFASGFLATAWIGEKTLIERMLGGQVQLHAGDWRKLNRAWVLFFLFSGLVNLYFAQAYTQSQNRLTSAVPTLTTEELAKLDCESGFSTQHKPLCLDTEDREKTWVSVKVFGLMGLTLLFILGQSIYLMRRISIAEPGAETEEP